MILAIALLVVSAPSWTEAGKSEHCTVYNRDKPGSDIREVMAVGYFDAPLEKVHAVIDDNANYKEFMAYTKESNVLRVEGTDKFVYERINAPFVSERDYSIKITHPAVASGVKHVFTLAPTEGPKPIDGVVRVSVLEGSWHLEPVDGGKRTKGTYYVYTSPGGSVPTFLVNGANNTAVPGLYEAIKKRLKAKG